MKNLMDVKQMAEKICSTVGSVYTKVSARQIPHWCVIKIGERLLFDPDKVDVWLESQRQEDYPIIKYQKWRFSDLII